MAYVLFLHIIVVALAVAVALHHLTGATKSPLGVIWYV
jgi:hypothetical protein